MAGRRGKLRGACVALLLAGTASAGETGPAPGAAFGFEDSDGARFELVLERLGSDGGRLWRVVSGDDPAAGEEATISRFDENAEGQMLELRQVGAHYRFLPHDCARTLGLCAFRIEGPQGVREFQRITGRDGKRWVYSLFEDRLDEPELVPVRIGAVTYDAAGVPVLEEWTDLETFATGGFRRVGAAE